MQNTPRKLARASGGAAGNQVDEDGLEEGTTHMNDEIGLEEEYRKHVKKVLKKEVAIWEDNEMGSENILPTSVFKKRRRLGLQMCVLVNLSATYLCSFEHMRGEFLVVCSNFKQRAELQKEMCRD